MLSSRTFKTRKPEICLFLLLLSTVLLYTGCFTLLMASNQRLRLFAGDIVARTITTSSLLPLFYVFPIVALLLAFIAAFKSWRRVALTICLLLVCNIVGAVVWHLIAFRSPVQFFEFVDVGVCSIWYIHCYLNSDNMNSNIIFYVQVWYIFVHMSYGNSRAALSWTQLGIAFCQQLRIMHIIANLQTLLSIFAWVLQA